MTFIDPRPALILVIVGRDSGRLAAIAGAGRPQDPPQQAQTRPIVRPIPAPPDVAAPPADAAKTKSGLATKVIAPGTGTDHPGRRIIVTVDYTGWNTKGVMFDSSLRPGEGQHVSARIA